MIVGIGADIVKVQRIERWLTVSGLTQRWFHPDELHQILHKRSGIAESLAARFAAKEAFGKALGSGLRNLRLSDICVQTDLAGKPEFVLYGSAKEALRKSGAEIAHLTITHESDIAMAMVVLELTGGHNGSSKK